MAKKDSSGYIIIHRKIFQNQFYFCEPFCRQMAWFDLLLLANHQEKTFVVRGVSVTVPRGSVGYSIKTLALRWSWSQGKVKRWISVLKKAGQIEYQKSNVTTLITILKYNQYQFNSTANSTADGEQTNTKRRQTNNDKQLIEKARTRFSNGAAYSSAPPLRKSTEL